MQDDMLEFLQEQERMKGVRRISGEIFVAETKAAAIMAEIRDRLRGFGCEIIDSGPKPLVTLCVWCDADREAIDNLAGCGFKAVIDLVIEDANATASSGEVDYIGFEDTGMRNTLNHLVRPRPSLE